jgi:hypothetical protein
MSDIIHLPLQVQFGTLCFPGAGILMSVLNWTISLVLISALFAAITRFYPTSRLPGAMLPSALWLRDEACAHYPDSEFARKYGSFV